jgi:hypothetical protein
MTLTSSKIKYHDIVVSSQAIAGYQLMDAEALKKLNKNKKLVKNLGNF